MNGVRFGNYHSYEDFGLILSSKTISFPKPKTETVNVPHMNGVIDLTDAFDDDVKFENRKLQFKFTLLGKYGDFSSNLTRISDIIHGQVFKIILDDDSTYYYEGRVSLNEFKTDKRTATIVFDCDVYPFKTDINSEAENWLWDTFSFVDGVIYKNILSVDGTRTETYVGGREVVVPEFVCSSAMTVTFKSETYNLKAGSNKMYGIRFIEGDNVLTFNGTGTVAVKYRRGVL